MENSKYGNIHMIIHQGILVEEIFNKFSQISNDNQQDINKIYEKIFSPYSDVVQLIKDVQLLGDISCFSLKRIFSYKEENEILFCCSCMNSKKVNEVSKSQITLDSVISRKISVSSASEKKICRSSKRENWEACPMRLNFKYQEDSKTYQITEDSILKHNHSSISKSFEVNRLF